MTGDHHLLAVTTTVDESTGEIKPLFSFPVQICPAVKSTDVKLDTAAPSGAPRKRRWLDESTGEILTDDQCIKGVRVGEDFRPISDEVINKIAEDTKIETIVALGNVPLDSVDFSRATGEYFVQSPAKGGSPKSYRILLEALREIKGAAAKEYEPADRKAQAIVVKRTARSRQKLGVIFADEEQGCLKLVELRFAHDLLEPDAQVLAPQTAVVDQKQIEVARKVIRLKLADGSLALDSEIDEAIPRKAEIIEAALNGDALPAAPVKIAAKVESDDLTALLEASLA